jgi:hypothetical protein
MPPQTPRPPDLDANGNPVPTTNADGSVSTTLSARGPKPPDLDANGNPVPDAPAPTYPWRRAMTAGADKPGIPPDVAAQMRAMGAGTPVPSSPAVVGDVRGAVAGVAPAVGGMVGGMVGGIPGAAVGGMAGDVVRQALTPAPSGDRGSTLGRMGREVVDLGESGAAQGAAQAAGEGVAWTGGKLASWLMNRATTRVTAQLAREFPDLSDTLIDNALTVSKGGYEKAKGMLVAAKAVANDALKTADATGATIPVSMNADLADSFKTAVLDQALKRGQVPTHPDTPLAVASQRLSPELQALFDQVDASVGKTFDLTPSQADLFKTQLQKESRALYLNRVAPNGPRALQAEAIEKADFATQLNSAIDGVASGYKAANAAAKPLIGAVRGIQQAIRPSGNLLQAMVRPAVGVALGGSAGSYEGGTPGALAGAVIGGAMTSPEGMSREAITLAHPVTQAILRQLPRALAAAVAKYLPSGPTAPSGTALAPAP